MDKEFFERKIRALTDDKLIDLLRRTGNEVNQDIFDLASREARLRSLQFVIPDRLEKQTVVSGFDDIKKLKKWNWGAFLLAPIWTLANKLEKWTILCFVPGVNVFVIFYLGLNGNRLAFEKSEFDSVADFMAVQKDWSRWGIRIFWIGLIVGLLVISIG